MSDFKKHESPITARALRLWGSAIVACARRRSPMEAVGLLYFDGGSISYVELQNHASKSGTFKLSAEETLWVHSKISDGTALALWHSHPTSGLAEPSDPDKVGHPVGAPLMAIVTLATEESQEDQITFWLEDYVPED